ncbi:MAG TPA: YetF domain-containing protein [Acidobacteriaceae bacterium]|nr:YetF domain-containing protein [Acidobacteriaceae bacterium]
MHDLLSNLFHLPVPILEKILRPVIVYIFLVACLRIFGKRELAQLNPFDLVVLLTLSNAVQNAIIGDDNSVTGGAIGAFSLLAINWIVVRLLFRHQKLNKALEGTETVLIQKGRVDQEAMKRETLSEMELLTAIRKQGLSDFSEVEKCVLEPNGTFYIEGIKPSPGDVQLAALEKAIQSLTREVHAMRAQLPGRPA